jgi:hypothetical protein
MRLSTRFGRSILPTRRSISKSGLCDRQGSREILRLERDIELERKQAGAATIHEVARPVDSASRRSSRSSTARQSRP